MPHRYSVWHRCLLAFGGFGLVLLLTACPKVPKSVRSKVPGANGDAKLDVKVHILPDANHNNPVAVDLVLVTNKKLLKELMQMSANDWFDKKRQVQLDNPKEIGLDAGHWEWAPGQVIQLDNVAVPLAINGAVVFAKYFTPGAHRASIDPHKSFVLTLGEDDICVQYLKDPPKPCEAPKKK